MSTVIYLIAGYGLLSLFCTTVLIAACIVAGRTYKLRLTPRFSQVRRSNPLPEAGVKTAPEVAPTPQRVFAKHLTDMA